MVAILWRGTTLYNPWSCRQIRKFRTGRIFTGKHGRIKFADRCSGILSHSYFDRMYIFTIYQAEEGTYNTRAFSDPFVQEKVFSNLTYYFAYSRIHRAL